MSAISAYFDFRRLGSSLPANQRSLEALYDYGPEGCSIWSDPSVSIGRNLMCLVPEDRFDRQPLHSQDGSEHMVADVSLCNRSDLERDLALDPSIARSDADILFAAWLAWGEACLDRILGAFAFVVWSPGRQTMFAARDHSGDRTLYYHRGPDMFALASMPQGLRVIPGVGVKLRDKPLLAYFSLLDEFGSLSFFEGIEGLPRAHYLRVTPHSFEIQRYWHPSECPPVVFATDKEYEQELIRVLETAVDSRTRAIGTVGTHLSGGFDSGSVTACAARRLAQRGQGLTAFTSVPQPGFAGTAMAGVRIEDEGPDAASLAQMYPNIDHILFNSQPVDLLGAIQRMTDAIDQPVFNVVNLAWFVGIADLAAARGIGVLLLGSEGNGTISYAGTLALGEFCRRGRWLDFLRHAITLRRHGDISVKWTIKLAIRSVFPRLSRRWLSGWMSPPLDLMDFEFNRIVNPQFADEHGLRGRKVASSDYHMNDNAAARRDFFDTSDTGAYHAALRALNRLDCRDPTADKRVYGFTYSIPPEQWIRGGRTKSLLRRAMKGRMPQSTLDRSNRGIQGMDWHLTVGAALPSFREEFEKVEQSPLARRVLNIPYIHELLDTWPTTGHETWDARMKWGFHLCQGIAMGYFLRTHDPDAPHHEDTRDRVDDRVAAGPSTAATTLASHA